MDIDIDLKSKYWKLNEIINIEDYFNPINLSEEKELFKNELQYNREYNPIFQYNKFDFDPNIVIEELNKLIKKFEKSESILKNIYIKKIEFDLSCINNIKIRDNSERYSSWLTSLYGIPKNNTLQEAIRIIENTPKSKSVTQDISSDAIKKTFIEELAKRNFIGWSITLQDIPAKVSINPVSKKITVNKDSLFSSNEVKRLIAHEIDTHILRNENGSLQKDKLFSYGFPDYLQTEEGLAITSEDKTHLLRNDDLRKYCSRVIAAYHTKEESFYNLFKRINKHHSFNQAYAIVSRTKRGLVDTSIIGGYTKDQVYLTGYLDLKLIDKEGLKLLFCGKIGVKNMSFIKQLKDFNFEYRLPAWLKN